MKGQITRNMKTMNAFKYICLMIQCFKHSITVSFQNISLNHVLASETTKSRNRIVEKKIDRFQSIYDIRRYRNVDFGLYLETGTIC